jgi:peptide/nickel transport system permease protein
MGTVAAIVLVLVAAPLLPLQDPLAQDLAATLQPPGSPGHRLGTDQFGRDLLSRIVWGGRISVFIAVVATTLSMGIGVPVGMASGYFLGRVDTIIMRLTDMMLAFPYILLALVIVAARGPGLANTLVAVAITNIPFYIRMIRSIVITISHQPYVEASVAIGAGPGRILRRVVFPAMVPYITVSATISAGWLILATSALSFLGLGAQPPQAEWGAMLGDARNYILIAPHIAIIPGIAIFVLVMALNLAGDALRDALDVELRDK